MWIRLIGVIVILLGLLMIYLGWRAMSAIDEIRDQKEWDDAVYGGGGPSGGYELVFGALAILAGALLALRLL